MKLRTQFSTPFQILIADDRRFNQKVVAKALRHRKISLHFVANGRQAYHQAQVLPVNLIFMDASMPMLDGVEATKAIRHSEQATGSHVPIIGLINPRNAMEKQMCLDAGMDDCLEKPIKRRELIEMVSTLMSDVDAHDIESSWHHVWDDVSDEESETLLEEGPGEEFEEEPEEEKENQEENNIDTETVAKEEDLAEPDPPTPDPEPLTEMSTSFEEGMDVSVVDDIFENEIFNSDQVTSQKVSPSSTNEALKPVSLNTESLPPISESEPHIETVIQHDDPQVEADSFIDSLLESHENNQESQVLDAEPEINTAEPSPDEIGELKTGVLYEDVNEDEVEEEEIPASLESFSEESPAFDPAPIEEPRPHSAVDRMLDNQMTLVPPDDFSVDEEVTPISSGEALTGLDEGERDFVQQNSLEFTEKMPEFLDEMRQHLGNNDFGSILQMIHVIQSVSEQMKAHEIVDLVENMKSKLSQGENETLPEDLESIELALERYRRAADNL